MIPDEAVEAAAGNYWDNSYTTDLLWIDAVATRGHDDETAQVRDMMRAALEAAAPYLMAAWSNA